MENGHTSNLTTYFASTLPKPSLPKLYQRAYKVNVREIRGIHEYLSER